MGQTMTPAGGTYWASLSFGGDYMKLRPAAAPSADKGIVAADITAACARAQRLLEALFRSLFAKATVDAWTGDAVPPLVTEWATELAAALLHHSAAASDTERRKEHQEWADAVLDRVRQFFAQGGLLLDGSGTEVARSTPSSGRISTAPRSSGEYHTEVFDDKELASLSERHGPGARRYATDEEIGLGIGETRW